MACCAYPSVRSNGLRMNAWIRQTQAGRSLFAMAMLLVLSLRVLVPVGYMPTATAQGIVVQLCSGVEGQKIVIDLGKKVPGEKQSAADSPCLFSTGLGQAVLPTGLQLLLPALYGYVPMVGAAIADLTVHRLAAPPPPSQGPPALR